MQTLTPEQWDAAQSQHQDTVVIAGAGTGKTTLLVARIQYLLDCGVPLSRIVVLTFTRKAAAEIKQRLIDRCGPNLSRMLIGTFHSVALELLGAHHHLTPINEEMADALAAEISKTSKTTVSLRMIDACREARAFGKVGTPEYILKATQQYEQRLKHEGAIDWLGMLLGAISLGDLLPEFDHVIIDEDQDTDPLQRKFATVLSRNAKTFFVGDDRQCFPAGTLIAMADGSQRPIEQVRAGDRVTTVAGLAGVTEAEVTATHSTQAKDMVTLHTLSGKTISMTWDHRLPVYMPSGGAGLQIKNERHFVYLMYRNGFGWRVGKTKNVWSRKTGERCDRMLVVASFATNEEALMHEAYLSLKYCIPTNTFRNHGNTFIAEETLQDLYRRLGPDYASGVSRFFADHPWVNAAESNVPMSNSGRPRKESGQDSDEPVVYLNLAGSVRPHRKCTKERRRKYIDRSGVLHEVVLEYKGNRSRKTFGDYGDALAAATALAEQSRGFVQERVRIRNHPSQRQIHVTTAGNVVEGMYLVSVQDGETAIDMVTRVDRLHDANCEVYDLQVDQTHLYVANEILVHNCIYQWRGVDPQSFASQPGERFSLTQTWRFGQSIADLANELAKRAGSDSPPIVASPGVHTEITWSDGLPLEEIIDDMQSRGFSHDDIAVLCRWNSQVEAAVKLLASVGINTSRRVARDHKTVLNILTYLANPWSTLFRERFLADKAAAKLMPHLASDQSLASAADLVLTWLKMVDELNDTALVIDAIDNVPAELAESFEWWKNRYAGTPVDAALRDYASLDQDEIGSGVTVCTIHQAKGLEFPAVIMPAAQCRRMSAEEWRTMLVGVTRAKQVLHLAGVSPVQEIARDMMSPATA